MSRYSFAAVPCHGAWNNEVNKQWLYWSRQHAKEYSGFKRGSASTFYLDRGSLSVRICHLEESGCVWMYWEHVLGLAFFWLLVTWHCVLPTQCKAGQSTVWQAGPGFSGTGNFALGKLTLEILSDLRKQTNKVVVFSLMALPCPLSSPSLLHRIGFSCSISFLPPMHLQLKEKKLLWTSFCFLFLGCFYSFYFITSMLALFPSISFSVLSLTFFSCPFFHSPGLSHTHPLGSRVTSQK